MRTFSTLSLFSVCHRRTLYFGLYLIAVILSTVQSAVSQIPPPAPGGIKINVADSLRNEGDIAGAIAEYGKLKATNPKDKNMIYNYACALSINKQIDSCFKYLYLAIRM